MYGRGHGRRVDAGARERLEQDLGGSARTQARHSRATAACDWLRHDGSVIFFLVRAMRSGQRARIAILLSAAAACVLIGALLFSLAEDLPFTTGLYWAITTATTVGYGDVTPHNGLGRVIASAVMLTTIPLLASVFALATGGYAAAGIRRILAMHNPLPEPPYRLVIGMSQSVPAILRELVEAGITVILVADTDPAGLPAEVHHIRADPTDEFAIKRAKPADAEQALITGTSDGDVLVSSVLVRKQAPDLPIVAVVSSASVREALRDLGVRQTMSPHDLIAATLAKSMEAPHAADMVSELVESQRHRLSEVDAAAEGAVGKALSVVRDERDGLVLGLVHDGTFSLGIADDPTVKAGDSLLIAEKTPPATANGRRAVVERRAAGDRPAPGSG
jgi:voltage-gated potassium channel